MFSPLIRDRIANWKPRGSPVARLLHDFVCRRWKWPTLFFALACIEPSGQGPLLSLVVSLVVSLFAVLDTTLSVNRVRRTMPIDNRDITKATWLVGTVPLMPVAFLPEIVASIFNRDDSAGLSTCLLLIAAYYVCVVGVYLVLCLEPPTWQKGRPAFIRAVMVPLALVGSVVGSAYLLRGLATALASKSMFVDWTGFVLPATLGLSGLGGLLVLARGAVRSAYGRLRWIVYFQFVGYLASKMRNPKRFIQILRSVCTMASLGWDILLIWIVFGHGSCQDGRIAPSICLLVLTPFPVSSYFGAKYFRILLGEEEPRILPLPKEPVSFTPPVVRRRSTFFGAVWRFQIVKMFALVLALDVFTLLVFRTLIEESVRREGREFFFVAIPAAFQITLSAQWAGNAQPFGMLPLSPLRRTLLLMSRPLHVLIGGGAASALVAVCIGQPDSIPSIFLYLLVVQGFLYLMTPAFLGVGLDPSLYAMLILVIFGSIFLTSKADASWVPTHTFWFGTAFVTALLGFAGTYAALLYSSAIWHKKHMTRFSTRGRHE